MEFVLMTTTSTPDTSRSGSVMKFGDYREDEEISEKSVLQLDTEFVSCESDSDDEDKALLEGFNLMVTRQRLGSYDFCTKITLDADQQKGLKLEVGVHVSEENPWKQIRRQPLLDYLPDDENAPKEVQEFRLKLFEMRDDDFILVGYAAPIIDIVDKNTYLFYVDVEPANEAVSLIRVLEAFERQRTRNKIYKYSRPWKGQGSDKQIDLMIEKKRKDKVEVEIQRLCPVNAIQKPLEFRFAEDVRDGYVELVPKTKENNIVFRRRISVAVQSAAQRVESEQQTDPTFPANAWTQYFYELPPDPEQLSVKEQIEADHSKKSQDESAESEIESEPIPPSEAMLELLKTLEFNAIDMYRDDYAYIASKALKRFPMPVITEFDCFIDPSICFERFVSAFVWHPTYSGVFITSYTYKTMNILKQDEKIDNETIMKNFVKSSNPVLLWSFDDNIYPKLVLDAPQEVTYLSFCPYDENMLIGALVTGQFIIWDMKDRLHQIENPEILTDKQEKNRNKMFSLMEWSKLISNQKQNIVEPAAITSKEFSHKTPITSIRWLNRKHSIATTGLIQESIKPNEMFRQFLTASIDGYISFWDLDFINPNEAKMVDLKRKSIVFEDDNQYVSPYRKLNDVIRPVYTIACEKAVTSVIFDDGHFSYEVKDSIAATSFRDRMDHNVIYNAQEKPTNRFIVSSLSGSIETFIWEGFLCKEGKPETIKQPNFKTMLNLQAGLLLPYIGISKPVECYI